MRYVIEPEKKIDVIEEVDVLVVGGGPGGMPAAIAAARKGLNVLIVENYGFFGGLATTGLMGPIFGYAPSGYPENKIILGGIPVELVRNLQKNNGAPDNNEINWKKVRFDPEIYKHVCDFMVQGSGVKTLFHSFATNVIMDNDRIDAVIIECKSGRKAVRAKIVIDATGDGDIAYFAGEAYTKGRKADGLTQPMGTKFIVGGVSEEAHDLSTDSREKLKRAISNHEINCYQLMQGEISDQGVTIRNDERTPTITRFKGDGTNVYDLTAAEFKLRKDTRGIVKYYRENIPGFENAFLRNTPPHVGVRETRQIVGHDILKREDVADYRKQPEKTIARGCWFFDIHCPRGLWSPIVEENGMCSMRCKVEPECYMKTKFRDQMLDTPQGRMEGFYDIPYGTIVPRKTKNLIVSGRCISADHYAMSSARVIATCLAIGEAAGLAAYVSLTSNCDPASIEIEKLQDLLRENGVPLDSN
jgi:hypothetical protein